MTSTTIHPHDLCRIHLFAVIGKAFACCVPSPGEPRATLDLASHLYIQPRKVEAPSPYRVKTNLQSTRTQATPLKLLQERIPQKLLTPSVLFHMQTLPVCPLNSAAIFFVAPKKTETRR